VALTPVDEPAESDVLVAFAAMLIALTVTTAVAVLLGSVTLAAVIVNVPPELGGVKVVDVPVAGDTEPPFVLQFALGLAVAGVTVALTVVVCVVSMFVFAAAAEIPTAATVTLTVAFFEVSVTLAAVIV
jgi:hypothetical protein